VWVGLSERTFQLINCVEEEYSSVSRQHVGTHQMLLFQCQQMTVWLNDLICQFKDKNNRPLFSVLLVSPSGDCFNCADCRKLFGCSICFDLFRFLSRIFSYRSALICVWGNSLTLFYSYFMSNYVMLFWFVMTTVNIFWGKLAMIRCLRRPHQQLLLCKGNSATQSSEYEDPVVFMD